MSRVCSNCGHSAQSSSFTGQESFFSSASPFATHNDPPLESQTVHIRDSLAHAKAYLTRVDEEMTRLREMLGKLREERQVLQSCVDNHISALSPTRRLPTEILSEIFAYSLINESYDSLDTTQGPWRLARVCSRWKTIMLYEKYWSEIYIEINSANLNAYALPVLEEWLTRSRDFPLSIYFYYPDSSVEIGQSVLDTLLFHSRRWRVAELSMMLDMFLWLMQAKGHFPSLERLLVNRLDRGPMQTIHAFDDAPKLVDLTIKNMQNISNFIHVPWPQLVRYDASEYSAEDHLDILNRTINLTECTLYSDTHIFMGIPPLHQQLQHQQQPQQTRVILPHLRRLTWHGGGISTKLTLPSLSHVSIKCDRRGEDNLSRLTSLISRSQSSLKSLKVSAPLHRSSSLVELLMLSENLTNLEIQLFQPSSSANSIITSLSALDSSTPCLVPNLTHLSVTLSSIRQLDSRLPFDHISFVEMVESRWKVIGRRRTVRLRSLRFEDMDFTTPPKLLTGLKALKEEGLEVVIRPLLLRDAVFV